MDDSDRSTSDDDTSTAEPGPDEFYKAPEEVIIDQTGAESETPGDRSSPIPLTSQDGAPIIKPRPYQLEMVEESLKHNIIVAMDTGSGKTHIAVMRMQHELERMPSHQLIWFLAPTVSLCAQQHEYIQSQISSVQVKFLSGNDGVDRWTHHTHWDAILKDVKIVVSTYQILLDALSHGFVRMEKLALIVFDEAHNCTGNYPGAKLMINFYHQRKAEKVEVPYILGLTASPVMRSNPQGVTKIEETLDAICRTPTKHRAELRLQVKLPQLLQVGYEVTPSFDNSPGLKALQSLNKAFGGMKLEDDPYYLGLLKNDTERGRRDLDKVKLRHKTWSRDQIKSFCTIAERVLEELGSGAAHYYISHVVAKVVKLTSEMGNNLGIWDIPSSEKQYIAQILRQVDVQGNVYDMSHSTEKVDKLMEVILAEPMPFSGIVFVKERATAFVLAHLLRTHPRSRDIFKIGVVVGTSNHAKRSTNIGELLDVNIKQDALALFKRGKINLVIATSVLEEGIDVPACNVVLCFEKPANLKSFVQRRGRARQRESKLVLLIEGNGGSGKEWAQLEADMRAIYEDEMRVLKELLYQEEAEDGDESIFKVESTNALIDLDAAVSHLYHFCSTLPLKEYADIRPDFICTIEGKMTRAKVILPVSVNEAVRVAESRKAWLSEKNAIKDAAFEAYVALYRAGLVGDNLLPLMRHNETVDDLMTSAVETRAALMRVAEQLNPWIEIARSWQSRSHDFTYRVPITLGELNIEAHLPTPIPMVKPFSAYWDRNQELVIAPDMNCQTAGPVPITHHEEDTRAILQAAFGWRFAIADKPICMQFSFSDTQRSKMLGLLNGDYVQNKVDLHPSYGLIRDNKDSKLAYTFKGLLPKKPAANDVQKLYDDFHSTPDDTPHLSLERLPRRLDFLHKILHGNQAASAKPHLAVLPVSRCTIDEVPIETVQLGLLIPSIIRKYEIALVAERLSTTLLKTVAIMDLSLIITSICASSAQEETNYQCLEFLGDCVLKMCTSVQLIAEYPLWHEGILSAKKDRLVANSRLSRAAVESGLATFIITRSFTGHKWRPPYIDTLTNTSNYGTREMSSKVLADVVEALIGAAMIDGGIPKALKCLQTFLPELSWQPIESRLNSLYLRAPNSILPVTLELVEKLIGYKFTKPSLLTEALTHASCNSGTGSLERFEFLGDSVLDYVIVTAMYPHNLSHVQMHLLRTAMVNADFLAFICMEWSAMQESTKLITPANKNAPIFEKTEKIEMPLWKFMRHASPKLGFVQAETVKRHSKLRGAIKEAIEHGTHYPWALLSRLQAQKFYSDIIESLLGAVYIDSGSFATCTLLCESMGILPYMRRILDQHVHIWHPKEELGVFADMEKVRYALGIDDRPNEEESGAEEGEEEEEREGVVYTCAVWVGEREVVRVGGGVSKEEVKTKAAERAVGILKRERGRGVCG